MDIDLVGVSDIDKIIVVGECKFRNKKMESSVYDTLVRRSKMIPTKYRIAKYLFFSLSGFTEWNQGSQQDIEFFSLSDLYENIE